MSQLSAMDFTVKEIVTEILTRFPKTRDCDYKLSAHFWRYECKKKGIAESEILKAYYNGNLTPADSITRQRRKIQEETERLRGQLWEERKQSREKTVRNHYGKNQ